MTELNAQPDGLRIPEELLGGDLVRISESRQTTPVVRIGGESFLAQLRSKMAAL